jgi:beta-galactosidase
MRSLGGGKPWLLMEQAPGAVQWRQTNAIKATGQMQAWSLQAVSRGADGICFFQWRQSVAGAEKFHSAMVPHAGTGSRIWRSVTVLGRQLESLAPVQGTRVTAEVAILLDWNSWWAIEGDAHPRTLDFLAGLEDWYASLYRRNVSIDFAHPAQDLSGYQLVIAPNLYLLSRTNAQRLAGYVASGGTLVVSYFSAIVDDNDHAYLDGYLDALQPVLGIRIDEFAPLASAGPGPCSIAVHSDRLGAFEGTIWSELVELQGAEVVAQFAESDLAGRPAVTRNDHGAGHAWYVATQPQQSALDAIIAAALGEAGVASAIARLPEGVEAQRRGDYLFLINQGVVDIDTSIGGHDILTGRSLKNHILAPRQTVVLDLHE